MNCCTQTCTDDSALNPYDEHSLALRCSSPVTVEADYISDTCPIDKVLGFDVSSRSDRDLPVAIISPKRAVTQSKLFLEETVPLTPIASAWKKIAKDSGVKSFRKEIYDSAHKMAIDVKEEIIDIVDDVACDTVAIAMEVRDMMTQNLSDKKMMIPEQNSINKDMVEVLNALSAKYDTDLRRILRKSKKIVIEKVFMTVNQENIFYLTMILGILMLCFCKILLAFTLAHSFHTSSLSSSLSSSPIAPTETSGENSFDVVNLMLSSFGGMSYIQEEYQMSKPFFDEQTVLKLMIGAKNFALDNFIMTHEDIQDAINCL